MKITNEFTVHTPIENAWRLLTDLEGIAPCMPGARLTGVEGDVYQGKVKVKVGPVISEFAGTARFAEKDDAGYRAVIDAKGRDARSAGNAAALVTAVLRADGESTQVSVDTDLRISGKLAQFGSGMIKEVSGKLLAQFVTNLEAKLAADEVAPDGPAASAAPAAPDALAASAAPAVPAAPVAPMNAPAETAAVLNGSDISDPAVPAPATFPVNRTYSGAADAAASEETTTPAAPASPVPARQESAPPAPATPAAGAPAPAAGPAGDDEPEPLDLLGLAGGSIYKRAVPVVLGVVVVGVVIAWLIVRG